LTAKEQLVRLLRIQELADGIREAKVIVDEAPGKIEEIEGHFRERNAEYVAIKERYDALNLDQKTRSGELTELEEKRKKLMDDLMQVQNQSEYAAMLKQIDSVKAQIADNEDAILKDMEEIEKLTGELQTHEEHIKEERETVEAERSRVEAEAQKANDLIKAQTAEREEVESELPPRMVKVVRQLELTRQGIFLTKAENGTCGCCFVRVRPQVFQEIKQATVVHTCSSCRRYLYHEPALRPPADATEQGADPGVKAMNDGAV
jgi:predicted  nucleic acid-binding Zn-ribbon protein